MSARSSSGSGVGALDDGRCRVAVEPHQPLEVRRGRAARRGGWTRRPLPPPAARGRRPAVRRRDRAGTAARARPSGPASSVDSSTRAQAVSCLRRLLGEAALIVGRQDLAGDRRRRLHDQPADLALELGEHLRAVALGGLARPDEDLLGGRDRLLRFLGLHARGRRAGFLDQLLALGVGLRQHRLTLGLDAGQLGLDLLGVGQAARRSAGAAPRASAGSACRRAGTARRTRCRS